MSEKKGSLIFNGNFATMQHLLRRPLLASIVKSRKRQPFELSGGQFDSHRALRLGAGNFAC
jgi:hypothetical protein